MPHVPACQHVIHANLLACQSGLRVNIPCVPTWQKRANFSFLRANKRANVPWDVPIFQLGVTTCQNLCQVFEHSSNEILREISINTCIILIYLYYCIIFFILLFEKFHIIIDIIVIRIICICVVEKNCIILRFHTSYNIKEKSEEFFFFIAFVFFAL